MKLKSIIPPKKPKGRGWIYCGEHDTGLGYECHRWIFPWHVPIGLIQVLSAVEVAEAELGPEYHISVSRQCRDSVERLDRNDTRFVLKAFGMVDADEDNHVPNGRARHFWMPVNENMQGYVCPCKDEEPAIKLDKGDFVWRGITD